MSGNAVIYRRPERVHVHEYRLAFSIEHLLPAILFYDYMLTINREINLFWKKPRQSWPFVLFIANRYLTVVGRLPPSIYPFWSPKIHTDYNVCCILCVGLDL
ncbi:hypothetical protein ID866_7963 [Astraeus odoratus]|nr:hypothetical protein ID866_7963 [Astraeus odoratus]